MIKKRDVDESDASNFDANEEIEESSNALGLNETESVIKNDSIAIGDCLLCDNNNNNTINESEIVKIGNFSVMSNETGIIGNETINDNIGALNTKFESKEVISSTDEPSLTISPILESSIEWSTMKNNDLDKTLYEAFYELLGTDSKSNIVPIASILFKKK